MLSMTKEGVDKMINKLFTNIKEKYNNYLKNHLGTNIAVVFAAIIVLIFDFDNASDTMAKTLFCSYITIFFTVFAECYTKDNKKRYILYAIGLTISILMSAFLLEEGLVRYVVGFLLALGSIIIYLMINNTKKTSDKYITSAITNLFKLGITGVIINTGIFLILLLYSFLISEINTLVFVKLELLITLFYYVPALIISLETAEEEESKFIYNIINYILLPLITIATAIIYLYLIKIIFSLDMPKNQLFSINAALISLGIPIIIMTLSYENNNLSKKVANILKYSLMPLVLLQIYCLSVRISQYSITTSRYVGIILIILEIISLVLLEKENAKKFKYILLPIAIISLIMFITPYLNIIDFPNYMQIRRLTKILPNVDYYDKLSKEQKEEVEEIYYYVSDEKYYPASINPDDLGDKIYHNHYEGDDYDYDYNDNYIYYTNSKKVIDVKEYSAIEEYDGYPRDFIIKVNKKEYNLTNFCDELNSYYEEVGDADSFMKTNSPIKLDEDTYLYVDYLTLKYNQKKLSIRGYILYK